MSSLVLDDICGHNQVLVFHGIFLSCLYIDMLLLMSNLVSYFINVNDVTAFR